MCGRDKTLLRTHLNFAHWFSENSSPTCSPGCKYVSGHDTESQWHSMAVESHQITVQARTCRDRGELPDLHPSLSPAHAHNRCLPLCSQGPVSCHRASRLYLKHLATACQRRAPVSGAIPPVSARPRCRCEDRTALCVRAFPSCPRPWRWAPSSLCTSPPGFSSPPLSPFIKGSPVLCGSGSCGGMACAAHHPGMDLPGAGLE